MAKKKRKRRPDDPNCPSCVYCGVNPGTEDEHVVAEAFFPEPRPSFSEYVIVPACANCNRGIWKDSDRRMNMDEEYARSMFILDKYAGGHPAARVLLHQKVLPSFQHSRSMPRLMFPKTTRLPLELPNELVLPNQLTTYIHWPRVERVIRKITLGLYYAEMKQRLPDTYEVVIEVLSLGEIPPSPRAEDWLTHYLKVKTFIPGRRRIAHGVFSYAYTQLDPNDPATTAWVLGFYDGVYFLITTRPTGLGSVGSKHKLRISLLNKYCLQHKFPPPIHCS